MLAKQIRAQYTQEFSQEAIKQVNARDCIVCWR